MADISEKDRIILRDLKAILDDMYRMVDEAEKELGKSSPAFSAQELDYLIKRLQLAKDYGAHYI